MKDSNVTKKSAIIWKNYTVYIGLGILLIVSSLLSDTFLYPMNIMNVAKQIAMPGVLAIGMTFVIISGGIDLSVGRVVAITGVFLAMLVPKIGVIPSILVILAFGALLGMAYGLLITKMSIPPFIVTLAGFTLCRGTALVITSSAPIAVKAPAIAEIGSGKLDVNVCYVLLGLLVVYWAYKIFKDIRAKNFRFSRIVLYILGIAALVAAGWIIVESDGLSILVLIFIAFYILFSFILNSTIFGRNVYAVGGNINAARLAGVNVHRTLIVTYMISAMLASIGGIMIAGRLGTGSPLIGDGYELDAIAAVVIGGTSMSGGSGRLSGTLVGVLLIGVLNNLLSLLGVTSDMQMIFKGVVILLAVVLDSVTSKKKAL